MTDHEESEISERVSAMSSFLVSNNFALDWANALDRINERCAGDIDSLRYNLKRLFGGMGSLNDLVVCGPDGSMDHELNEKMDFLRSCLRQTL